MTHPMTDKELVEHLKTWHNPQLTRYVLGTLRTMERPQLEIVHESAHKDEAYIEASTGVYPLDGRDGGI